MYLGTRGSTIGDEGMEVEVRSTLVSNEDISNED
jgi:hypothetical protein